jgi:hypothetical protein
MRFELILFAIFGTLNSFSQALSGTYTIGGASPDFPSLANAVNNLNSDGVGDGGVEFLIREGTYELAFTITAVGSPDRPIVFRSENNDASLVNITTVVNDDVITIDGAAYVTFEYLSISVVGSSAYSAFEIQDGANHININNCLINGSSGNLTAYAGSCIYASENVLATNCSDIVISDNTFIGGAYAMSFDMVNAVSDSIVFMNNFCINQYAGGLFMRDLYAPEVIGNSISTNQDGNVGYTGIGWNNCDGPGKIIGNYVFATDNGRLNYGIELNSSAGETGNPITIANNSIQVQNENSICYGLAQSNNCNNYRIFQNTLFISGGSSNGNAAYQTFTFEPDTDFFNNILITSSEGGTNRCVYIANSSGINFIDYNVYWTSNAGSNFTGYFGGSAYNDLNSFVAETGETYSLSMDPMMEFVIGVGWKASNELLMNTGLFINDYSSDIDGNIRTDPPSIGAHEIGQISTSLIQKNTSEIKSYVSENELIVFLSNEISHIKSLRLYDMSGKLIDVTVNGSNHNSISISVSNIARGCYVLIINDEDDMVYAGKVVLLH